MPRKSDNHRKLYKQHYGPIGKDASGRSLEVHHINGNHSDNRIENLTLVTIKEHYDIHYAQGDWAACALMSARAKIPPEEVSRLSSLAQLARVNAGTHHWQGDANNRKRIEDGTHPFLDSDAARDRNLKRVDAGSHNLLKRADGTSQASDMVAVGRHHFVNNNPAKNKSKAGTLPSQIKLSCVFCKRKSSLNNFNKLHKSCGDENIAVAN